MVSQGGSQGLARGLKFERLCLQSLGGALYVPKVFSNYNLLGLSLYDLARLSFCCFWPMSLAEVDQPLRFEVSIG